MLLLWRFIPCKTSIYSLYWTLYIVKKTVAVIVTSGHHYTIQVKKNEPSLLADIEQTVFLTAPLTVDEQDNKGHGRVEKRRVSVYIASNHPKLAAWKHLKTYIVVERWRTDKGEQRQEKAYYISDLQLTTAEYYDGTRGHWGIKITYTM